MILYRVPGGEDYRINYREWSKLNLKNRWRNRKWEYIS
jgi:hypothetical protein